MATEDSAFFLFFRPFIKYILHKLTGETEIERVSRNRDILGLEKSIALSKMLITYRERHCHWQEQYYTDLCQQLCAIKQIEEKDSKFRVGVALQVLHSWKHAIHQIEKVRKIAYDSRNENHQKMLMEVWSRLRPNRKIKARKSQQWIQLGFQAEDPATDFRGAGVLGLINLHGWVGTVEGRQAFKVADNNGTDYFFSSASLFLTMLSIELLKEMYIPPQYWILRDNQSVLLLFQVLFEAIWTQFALFWNLVRDKSMMQFNVNLLAFAKQTKQSRISSIVQRLNLKKGQKKQ